MSTGVDKATVKRAKAARESLLRWMNLSAAKIHGEYTALAIAHLAEEPARRAEGLDMCIKLLRGRYALLAAEVHERLLEQLEPPPRP